jgi:hypothetical protein
MSLVSFNHWFGAACKASCAAGIFMALLGAASAEEVTPPSLGALPLATAPVSPPLTAPATPGAVAAPVAPEAMVYHLPAEELAAYQERIAALMEREQQALTRFAGATPEQLQRLSAAQAAGISPDLLEWEEGALAYYLPRMQAADPQVGSVFPERDATLDVTMVGIELDITVSAQGSGMNRTLTQGEPQLQVARTGSPEVVILWIEGLGYVSLPPEYVQPYIDRVARTPLQIGGR